MKSLFKIIALSLMIISLSEGINASQDCYGAVLDGYSKDSNSFQIYAQEVAEDFENQDLKASAKAIDLLEEKLDCSKGAFEVKKISCKEIIPGNSSSKVCYVDAKDGYFFVSIDMMEQVNIIFSRWD